eukprot:Nitzschia sp. Nitz4//scaffold240_size29840//27475//28587//NITZ4_008022-RA/size29840-processed-gene-0.42-mRNA-1//-1//CDS//3329543762//7828//frame0
MTKTILLSFPELVELKLQTIDRILAHLAHQVTEAKKKELLQKSGCQDSSIEFVFHFSKISLLDVNVTPAIRKFAREHNVRGVHICNVRSDVSRLIITNMGGFFNLRTFLLEHSTPQEPELCLPLVLRKTVSSIAEIRFSNMPFRWLVLQEWASVLLGCCSSKKGPPLASLAFTNVLFDDSLKSIKYLGLVLKCLCHLKEFRFEWTMTRGPYQENKLTFAPLGKGLSKIPSLQKLTLTNVNIEDSNEGMEAFFASGSLVRKSLQELTLSECNISLATVRLMSFSPGPFENLETIDVSRNASLDIRDVVRLRNIYKTVLSDFDTSDDEERFSSDDDSATEVEGSEDTDSSTEVEPWDFTQLDTTLQLTDLQW